jgi:hypothetical protein
MVPTGTTPIASLITSFDCSPMHHSTTELSNHGTRPPWVDQSVITEREKRDQGQRETPASSGTALCSNYTALDTRGPIGGDITTTHYYDSGLYLVK